MLLFLHLACFGSTSDSGQSDSDSGSGEAEVFQSVSASCDAAGDFTFTAQTISGVEWVRVTTNAANGAGIEMTNGYELSSQGSGAWSLVTAPDDNNVDYHDCQGFDEMTHTFNAWYQDENHLESIEP